MTKPNERIVVNETRLRLLMPSPWERTATLTKRGGHSAARPRGAPTHRAVMLAVPMHAGALPPRRLRGAPLPHTPTRDAC